MFTILLSSPYQTKIYLIHACELYIEEISGSSHEEHDNNHFLSTTQKHEILRRAKMSMGLSGHLNFAILPKGCSKPNTPVPIKSTLDLGD